MFLCRLLRSLFGGEREFRYFGDEYKIEYKNMCE